MTLTFWTDFKTITYSCNVIETLLVFLSQFACNFFTSMLTQIETIRVRILGSFLEAKFLTNNTP